MLDRATPRLRPVARGWRWIAFVALLAALTPAHYPRVALADDAVVSTCNQTSFDTALDTVQATGGGKITFSCSGVIFFTTEKTITSHVEIDGGGVTLDGENSTRLFDIESDAALTLVNLTIQNGSSTHGGAIWNAGVLAIRDSNISHNSASSFAGAIYNFDSGTLIVTGSTFVDNSMTTGGGGAIYSAGTLTVVGSSFSSNLARQGGAIEAANGTATIAASTFSGNVAASSGNAINNLTTMTIDSSTFVSNIGGESSTFGGAIGNGGSLTVSNSTFSDNNAGSGIGGAIYNGTDDDLTVSASTFTGNLSGNGGAIYNRGSATITGSTISGNSATQNGGGLQADSSGTYTLSGTIIANNSAATSGDNCFGIGASISSSGSNLSNDTTCALTGTGDVQNSSSINLGALADNGGPTQTMLPGAGSAAFDRADCALSTAADQRGADRPDAPATTCDVGAVERGATVPVRILAFVDANGVTLEGQPAALMVAVSGPSGISYDHDFDCGDDGTYEVQGSGSGVTGTASCDFDDDGAFTVRVQSCDAANASDCDTATVGVNVVNSNPAIASVTNDGPVDAGSNATITVTASDPGGPNDPLMFEFDCDNDATFDVGPQSGNTAACAFPNAGDFDVSVRVTDGDGGAATGSTTVSVLSVDPEISSVTNDGPIDEGSSATITVSATNPTGSDDELMYEFDCNDDGTFEAGSQSENSAACTFGEDGSYSVPVRVSNDAGDAATGSTTVTVDNADPVISAVTNFGPVGEGNLVLASVAATDPAGSNDQLMYEFDCDNDGTYEVGPQAASLGECTFTEDGDYQVNARVTDDDGGAAHGDTIVSVINLDPAIAEVTNDGPVVEGGSATITVTATDPAGLNDPLTYAFDCDDNGSYEVGPGASNATTCAFADDGAYTVGVQVSDDDGGAVTGSTVVTVTNAGPTISAVVNNGPVAETGQATISVTADDPGGVNDPLSYTFDCDDDGNFETAGAGHQASCAFPDDGDFTVGVQVNDGDGATDTSTTVVTVINVAPEIQTITTSGPAFLGQPVTISVSASDIAGALDPLTYAFDCDADGVYETAGNGNVGTCPLSPGAATTTIGVQVSDDDLGVTAGSVDVHQTLTLCGNYASGQLRMPGPGGVCAGGTIPLTLPATPVTLCIDVYSGGISLAVGAGCGATQMPRAIPGSGPLPFCGNMWTGNLRANLYGGPCGAVERPGVIPG